MSALMALCLAISAVSCSKPSQPEMTKSQVEAIVKEYIKSNPAEIAGSLQKYQEDMRKNAQEEALKQALANRVEVPLEGSPSTGEEQAPVTVVEFSDFQCPYCARSLPVIDALMGKYKGQIRLVFKHSPLPFHAKAPDAAKASMAAAEQGHFWEFRRKLMETQNEWGQDAEPRKLFAQYAKGLELDTAKFLSDMDNPEFQKRLDEDTALAQKLGVGGTPTYFINGARVVGAQEFAFFDRVVGEVLKDKPGA